MRWCRVSLLVLGLSCGADAQDLGDDTMLRGGLSNQAFSDGFTRPAGGVTVLFDRNFVLNASLDSTPSNPPCVDSSCVLQCTAVGTTWTCLDGTGAAAAFTVNQGVGATAYTDPLGFNALDTTNHTKRPSITGNAALNAAFAAAHTIVYIGHANNSIAVSSVEPIFSFHPTGCSDDLRAEEPIQKLYFGNAGATTVSNPVSGLPRGPSFGWGMSALYWTGSNVSTRLMGNTVSAAVASNACSSGGTLFFHDSSGTNPSGGSIQSFTLYNADKSSSLTDWENMAGGLRTDASSPITFVRDGQAWLPAATMGSREEPYAPGMPVVTSRGIEVHSGGTLERPSANGWILDNASSGLPKSGLAAASWAQVSTPTINSDVAAGVFGAWATNNTAATEMDEIVDTSGAADQGVKGTLQCSDNHLAGAYTMGVVARQGATGTTKDKMRLGLITDGTVGSPCTTWIRARDGASVTTLTTTPEFYICNFAVTGSPTSIIGEVLVGSAAADTGSIIVEAPTCTAGSSNSWPRPHSIPSAGDSVTIPTSETQTWPTGGSTGIDIEQIFTTDMMFPPAGNLNEPNNGSAYIGAYVLDSQQASNATLHAVYMILGSGDGTHPSASQVAAGGMYLQFSMVPSNSGVDAAHCLGDVDGITKVVAPSLGISSAKPGDQFVWRVRVTPRAAASGFARGDLHVYFDTCNNASTCHATTERQVYQADGTTLALGVTTGNWCTLDARSTWGTTGMGARLNAGAWMDGAVARLTVKEIK